MKLILSILYFKILVTVFILRIKNETMIEEKFFFFFLNVYLFFISCFCFCFCFFAFIGLVNQQDGAGKRVIASTLSLTFVYFFFLG
jgi:hypothetical protein